MADLYSSKTFAADPYLEVTHYDSEGVDAPTIMTLEPPIVSRPSVIKFTKDLDKFAVVTDKLYIAPVKDLESPVDATGRILTMSKNGKTVTVFSNGQLDIWLLKHGKHVKAHDNFATTNVVSISPDGNYVVIAGVGNLLNVYHLFGGAFVLEHTFVGNPGFGAVIVNGRMVWWSQVLGLRQCDLATYTETAVAGALTTYQYQVVNRDVSPSGAYIAMQVNLAATPTTVRFAVLALIGGVYQLTAYSANGGGAFYNCFTPCFDQTETQIVQGIAGNGSGGATGLRIYTYALNSGGTLSSLGDGAFSSGSEVVGAFRLSRPPTMLHVPADPEYNNMICHITSSGTHYMRRISRQGSFQMFPVVGGSYTPGVAPGTIRWLSDMKFLVSGGSFKMLTSQISSPSTTNNSAVVDTFPAYDVGATAANVLNFVISDDYRYVFYCRTISGVDHLFGGDTLASPDGKGPLGTYVSLYHKVVGGFEVAEEPLAYPAGYKVRNAVFRTEAGTALSFMLTDGADNTKFGRYMGDTLDPADLPILVESGKDLAPTLVNSYLAFGPDEYFAATHDYSATDSKLKLFKFSTTAMDFVEKFSLTVTFGPLTISPCWDVIIANGDNDNPFTLYKRIADTLVLQDIPPMEWPDGLGVAVGLVAMEDCSGFTVVTDEGKVIIIEIPEPPEDPEDPPLPLEIVDVIDLFPLPDPELIDPDEPLPLPEIPDIIPEIEIIDDVIVITYPPDPLEPDPDDPDPLQPSPPIIPPSPIPIPPTQKPPLPPNVPPPLNVGSGSGTAGPGLKDPFRGPRATVNITYER